MSKCKVAIYEVMLHSRKPTVFINHTVDNNYTGTCNSYFIVNYENDFTTVHLYNYKHTSSIR